MNAFGIDLSRFNTSGGGGSEITFRSTGDDVDRIVATVDANGNRTAVILDPDDAP